MYPQIINKMHFFEIETHYVVPETLKHAVYVHRAGLECVVFFLPTPDYLDYR